MSEATIDAVRTPPARAETLVSTDALFLASVTAGIVAVVSLLAWVGADSLWLAAMGKTIAAAHAIPEGVPFATADSSGWHNVPVLAELAFHGLVAAAGLKGLLLGFLAAVALAFWILARGAVAEGATAGATGAAMAVAGAGALQSLIVVRAELFSLVLFPVLLALLRSEARRPTRRIWLVPPLLALWSNLHGAVLVALAVVLAYLVVCRARREPLTAGGVALAAPAALCLTPAASGTVAYYHGVLTNVAAERGTGLWAPLSRSGFGILVAVGAGILLLAAARARPPSWEIAAILGLSVLTMQTARSGVWLVFFLVAPAARSFRLRAPRLRGTALAAVVALAAVGVTGGPHTGGPSPHLLGRTLAAAAGGSVLAEPALAERVAAGGGRILLGDPLDAFSPGDQALYLDWIDGGSSGRRALARTDVVLVQRGSPADALTRATPGFVRVESDGAAVLYRRAR